MVPEIASRQAELVTSVVFIMFGDRRFLGQHQALSSIPSQATSIFWWSLKPCQPVRTRRISSI
jgi:hypothetical protein